VGDWPLATATGEAIAGGVPGNAGRVAKERNGMSLRWRIVYQQSSVVDDIITQVGSLGSLSGPITFTIENVETGETREVTAWDRDDLGRRIAAGEFDNE
jgi:hypothetical protein